MVKRVQLAWLLVYTVLSKNSTFLEKTLPVCTKNISPMILHRNETIIHMTRKEQKFKKKMKV